MTHVPDLRELVGDGLSEQELAELERADALLRAVPAPPADVPASLTRAVRAATPAPLWTRRRLVAALALAAALSALSFAAGTWVSGSSGELDARATVRLEPTASAQEASGVIRLGSRDAQGNWTLELQTSGLPRLPAGGYYVLWLAKGRDYAGTCGTFRTGPAGSTVTMNASYELGGYDRWVVSAVTPGRPAADAPWLLEAPIGRAY